MSPAEAAGRAAFTNDHYGMSTYVRLARLGPKPVGSDGQIATALGPLTRDQFDRFQAEGLIDAYGRLALKWTPVKSARVKNRRGGSAHYMITATRDDLLAEEDHNQRLLEVAERIKADLAATSNGDRGLVLHGEWLSRQALRSAAWALVPEGLDDAEDVDKDRAALAQELSDLVDEPDDQLPAPVADYEPTEAEETSAREAMYGLEPGTLSEGPPEKYAEREEAEIAAEVARWAAVIKERRAAGDPRFAPDQQKHCTNPNGCPNAVKGRGTKCGPCFAYAARHDGDWRPSALLKRQRHRQQGF
jgi:hypothetical protein